MSACKEDELLEGDDNDGILLKDDFDDDILLGDDVEDEAKDAVATKVEVPVDEPKNPPEVVEVVPETEDMKEPESNTNKETASSNEETLSESDDEDGGRVQVVVHQDRLKERDHDEDEEEEEEHTSSRSRFQQERVVSTRGGKAREGIPDSLDTVEISAIGSMHTNMGPRGRGRGRFRNERPRPYGGNHPRMMRPDGPRLMQRHQRLPGPRMRPPCFSGPVPPPPAPPNFNIPPPGFPPHPNGMHPNSFMPPFNRGPPNLRAPPPPLLPPPPLNIPLGFPPMPPCPPPNFQRGPPPNLPPPSMMPMLGPPPLGPPPPSNNMPVIHQQQNKGQKIYVNKNFRPTNQNSFVPLFDPSVPPPMVTPARYEDTADNTWSRRHRDRSRERDERRYPDERYRERSPERRYRRDEQSPSPPPKPRKPLNELEKKLLEQKKERERVIKMKEERRRQAARDKLGKDPSDIVDPNTVKETKEEKQKRQVILSKIEENVNEGQLKSVLQQHPIERIRLIRERQAAFVFFRTAEGAQEFCRKNPKLSVGQHTLDATYAVDLARKRQENAKLTNGS